MELNATKRVKGKKSEIKRIRREGDIPAILYSKGKEGEQLTISGKEFHAVLRQMPQNHLATTIFTLKVDGKSVRALVKDIQYHVTRYDLLHLDFIALDDAQEINVNVPIVMVGERDCVGVKLGGALRQVIDFYKVRVKPKNIPTNFTIDVSALEVGQSKRLSDISLPEGIIPRAPLGEVAVVVGKR